MGKEINPTREIETIVADFPNSPVATKFANRIKEGQLTRDENPTSHFCVYFAAYDPDSKRVFIGHHKKSDLWLFNGGHMDEGEVPEEVLEREMGEEWGINIKLESIGKPRLLTITSINHPKIACKEHFDIWYFVPVSKANFTPDETKLATEFYTTGWRDIKQAREIITDSNTLIAISEFEKLFTEKKQEELT